MTKAISLLWKVDISWRQLCHQQLCTRWWRLFKLDYTYGVASRSPFPPWHCLLLACVTNKTKSRIMHAAILLVTIPPRAHPRGFAIFFFPGGLFPTPGHAERDNSPALSFWSTTYTYFATSVNAYKRKSTCFHNFYEGFPWGKDNGCRNVVKT